MTENIEGHYLIIIPFFVPVSYTGLDSDLCYTKNNYNAKVESRALELKLVRSKSL